MVLAQGTASFTGSIDAPPDLAQYTASNSTEPDFEESSSEEGFSEDDRSFQSMPSQYMQRGDRKAERKAQKEEQKAARKAQKAERKAERKTLKKESKSARKTEKAGQKRRRKRDDTWRLVIAYKAYIGVGS